MKAPARPRRQCPVPLCGASLRQGHLMCGSCWSRVPRPLQAAVNQSWAALRGWRPGIAASLVHVRKVYDEACTAAITAAEGGR